MAWEAKTRQFAEEEMAAMESMAVHHLAEVILASDPLVALRVLAELLLHDDPRLDEVRRPEVESHWQGYVGDSGVDDRDRVYANLLREEKK